MDPLAPKERAEAVKKSVPPAAKLMACPTHGIQYGRIGTLRGLFPWDGLDTTDRY